MANLWHQQLQHGFKLPFFHVYVCVNGINFIFIFKLSNAFLNCVIDESLLALDRLTTQVCNFSTNWTFNIYTITYLQLFHTVYTYFMFVSAQLHIALAVVKADWTLY
jgi:hypothetical protein